jgi:uncharacterized protein YggU (UPF0235/DUF167 family)
MHGEAIKIRIAGPPQDQRANGILIDFIAEKLGVPASRVKLARGQRSRSKLIEVSQPGVAALTSLRDWAV